MKASTQAIIKALFILKSGSERSTAKWTEDTVMCKNRGCVCEGCIFERYPCNLKNKVIALVREFGKPKEVNEPTTVKECA